MEAYLDNSATTKVLNEVSDLMAKIMTQDYGNPSSMHKKGVEAERYVKTAKENFAKILKVSEKEIFFTSGGTESNNMAVIGTAMANKRAGNHIITTSIEHPSVTNPMHYLEEQGFRVSYLPVDHQGHILLDRLEASICEDTILISIMYVNNEIGAIQPIEQVKNIIQNKKPDIIFHVDAIQAFGKIKIFPKKMGIDLLSISGHKIHGPKGVGVLYVRDKVKIKPLLFGGEQQNGMRSGTENVPGIAGIGEAARMIYDNFDAKIDSLYELKDYFINQVKQLPDVIVNTIPGKVSAPHIVNVSFSGVKSEVLLHALEDRDVYVSSGSACSSHKSTTSATLRGIGVAGDLLDSTIRFSFQIETSREEIDYCLRTLDELLAQLRKYKRR